MIQSNFGAFRKQYCTNLAPAGKHQDHLLQIRLDCAIHLFAARASNAKIAGRQKEPMSMDFLQIIIACLLITYGSTAGPPSDIEEENCPVQHQGKCFKIFKELVHTRVSGNQFCQRLEVKGLPTSGHLANVYSNEHFRRLADYAISVQGPDTRDPAVLLGMTYNTTTGVTRNQDGTISNFDWKAYGRPLSWGSNMIMRASNDRRRSTKLVNLGDDAKRYNTIMCEFVPK